MNRLLLALLLCAACKHSTSSSSTSHSETSTTTDSTSSETGTQTTVTTTSEAPGKTTTTVEEFAAPPKEEAAPEEAASTDADGGTHEARQSLAGRSTTPRQGPLVKRTVTVTEHGAETSETHQQATSQAAGATETRAQGKVDATARAQSASAPSAGCIGASWLWGAAVLAGIVGVLYFAIKMRKSVV